MHKKLIIDYLKFKIFYMLEVKRIKRRNKDYKNIEELMLKSFPKDELFSFRLLNFLSKRRNCNYLSYYDQNKLIGISFTYKYKDLVFILYLAISKEFKNKGYGSKILNIIKENNPNSDLVLNVEPLIEDSINFEERKRRFNFYFKNGFYKTGYIFKIEPPYDVLSTSKELDLIKYQKLLKKMMISFNPPSIEKE